MKDYSKRQRIDVTDLREVAFWSRKWGVDREQIMATATRVGPLIDDIAAEIGQTLYYPETSAGEPDKA